MAVGPFAGGACGVTSNISARPTSQAWSSRSVAPWKHVAIVERCCCCWLAHEDAPRRPNVSLPAGPRKCTAPHEARAATTRSRECQARSTAGGGAPGRAWHSRSNGLGQHRPGAGVGENSAPVRCSRCSIALSCYAHVLRSAPLQRSRAPLLCCASRCARCSGSCAAARSLARLRLCPDAAPPTAAPECCRLYRPISSANRQPSTRRGRPEAA